MSAVIWAGVVGLGLIGVVAFAYWLLKDYLPYDFSDDNDKGMW